MGQAGAQRTKLILFWSGGEIRLIDREKERGMTEQGTERDGGEKMVKRRIKGG